MVKSEVGKIKIVFFKGTVLEDYLELEARSGTKIKLVFQSFVSYSLETASRKFRF